MQTYHAIASLFLCLLATILLIYNAIRHKATATDILLYVILFVLMGIYRYGCGKWPSS